MSKALGKTVGDTVREYFPDASNDDIEFIVWEKTGYPSFWNIPEDGKTAEECFRKQLQDFKNEISKPPMNPNATTEEGGTG